MRLFSILLVMLAGGLFAPLHPAAHAADAPGGETPDITPLIEQYRDTIQKGMLREHIPGLAIVVVDDRNVLWQEGFGFTDTDRRIPVTTNTPFSIQSMSKSFTTLAVLLAVQDGLLDLDTPLSTYLPDFRVNSIFEPDAADRITLRHLLSHTAGFTHEAPVANNYVLAPGTFETHIASIQDTWLKFPVGQMYSYSNLGIDLAAYILQEQAGVPFAQYAEEKLFTPLGMTDSTFDIDRIAGTPGRAIGHDVLIAEAPLVSLMASGGVYTTAADMARYLQFHLNGGVVDDRQLLSQDLLEMMYAPQYAASEAGNYGMGIGVFTNHDARMLAHGGGGFGFLSNMIWYPELELGIATLSNTSSNNLLFNLEPRILDDIMTLDPGLYTRRAAVRPPAFVLSGEAGSMLSGTGLEDWIRDLAPAPTPAQLAAWRDYSGVYGVENLNHITQVMVVAARDGSLTLDGGPIHDFGSGLFFLANGEALNLAADPPTYRNIPLRKLNTAYFWFLRGISTLSLLCCLGAVLALPVSGVAALFRRRRTPASRPQRGFPGWLTSLLTWLAALLGVVSLVGTAAMAVLIRGGMLPDPGTIWSQFPALVYGHLPAYQYSMPWYVQLLVLLPSVILVLAVTAGVGLWQAWRARRWSLIGRIFLTVVIALLVVMAVLII